jgi:hypothetical protein
MPSDFAFKAANAFHRGVLKLSGGRLGWKGSGVPVLELTTMGRKSGQPRTVTDREIPLVLLEPAV